MSAYLLAHELGLAGLRPERVGQATWHALCPVCWGQDPSRRSFAVWEWSDGHEQIACWNQDCPSNENWQAPVNAPPFSTTESTGVLNAPLWLAIIERIGLDGLARAWGMKRSAEIAEAVDQAYPDALPRFLQATRKQSVRRTR